jgi:hypothetical protein
MRDEGEGENENEGAGECEGEGEGEGGDEKVRVVVRVRGSVLVRVRDWVEGQGWGELAPRSGTEVDTPWNVYLDDLWLRVRLWLHSKATRIAQQRHRECHNIHWSVAGLW